MTDPRGNAAKRAAKKKKRQLLMEIRRDFKRAPDPGWGSSAKPDKRVMDEAALVTCPECGRGGNRHGVWCPRR